MSVHTSLDYQDSDGRVYTGELYVPNNVTPSPKVPGVLIFPAFRGVTQLEMDRAKTLAEEHGFVALVADIYGTGVRFTTIPDALTVIRPLVADRVGALKPRLEASLKALKSVESVDQNRLAAFGFCLGGMCALDVARHRFPGFKAIISFHGTLTPIEGMELEELGEPCIQVHHGDADSHIPQQHVDGFQEEMRARKADFVFVSHGKAMHSFTDPTSATIAPSGVGYDENADRRSWKATINLLREVFG